MSNERLAFIEKICGEPDEDTHRLVYADWLDDQAETTPCQHCCALPEWADPKLKALVDELMFGGPVGDGIGPGNTARRVNEMFNLALTGPAVHAIWQRGKSWYIAGCQHCLGSGITGNNDHELAEFIRIQCELTKPHPCTMPYKCIWGPRGLPFGPMQTRPNCGTPACHALRFHYPKLRSRQEVLLVSISHWCGMGLGELTGRLSPVYVRGFIQEVTCSPDEWLHLADLLYWHPDQTETCSACGKLASYRRKKCAVCQGKGHVPRPCPQTAMPIKKVRFTAHIDLTSGDRIIERWAKAVQASLVTPIERYSMPTFVRQIWPRIEFEFITGYWTNED